MRQRGDGGEAGGTRGGRFGMWIALACASTIGACTPCATTPIARDAACPEPSRRGLDAGSDAGADAGPDAAIADAGALEVADAHVELVRRPGRFFGQRDTPVRAALANEAIAAVERGHGGRSLAFRISLADGSVGYFKPEQRFNGMKWYAEVAAYHLDRELGLGRVAPVVSRRIAWSDLDAAAEGDERIDEILVDDEGYVRGAFIAWVDPRPTVLPLPSGWEAWLRIEADVPAVTPYQPADDFRRALVHVDQLDVPDVEEPEADTDDRMAEMSDLIVFDFLTHNGDRWGTSNVNVRTIGPRGPLMYLDNAAGFAMRRPRNALMDARLEEVQRFRKSTIDAIRALDLDRFAQRLDEEPLAPILDERQLANLATRRARVLEWVDALVADNGEDAVYAW